MCAAPLLPQCPGPFVCLWCLYRPLYPCRTHKCPFCSTRTGAVLEEHLNFNLAHVFRPGKVTDFRGEIRVYVTRGDAQQKLKADSSQEKPSVVGSYCAIVLRKMAITVTELIQNRLHVEHFKRIHWGGCIKHHRK